MQYAPMLGNFRRFLLNVNSLQQEFVQQYTLHSLKATLLVHSRLASGQWTPPHMLCSV